MAPETLTHVTVGLGWNSSADLDAAVILMDRNGDLVDVIYYDKLSNENKSIMHTGDIKDGTQISGDDEAIFIDLKKVPENIETIWAVITIKTEDQYFDGVKGAYCRMMDTKSQ
tara:strand:- start:235 stop:573 length:339 start_codon:yes stop_codon:yes gene_type:complete